MVGDFGAHFRSNLKTLHTVYLCQSIPNLQRMKSELQQLA